MFAVPLTGDKKQLLSALKVLIDEQDIKPIQKTGEALFQLEKGKQLAKLPKGLRLLYMKAMHPELELWRLGHKAGVSDDKTYINLDPNLTHHTDQSKYLSEYLASMTSNRLREAVIIMENAARGRFPCTNASLLPKFDQDEMITLLKDSLKLRERRERGRLYGLHYKRKKQ